MNSSSPRPDVILLHGMWGTADLLDRVAAPLQRAGYRTFQPTLPHHQRDLSAADRAQLGHMGIPEYATFLRDYIDGLQLTQPPILLGHSMGGLLAQHLAATIPTSALALIAPANPAGINCITPWGVLTTSTALLRIVTRNRLQRPWHWILNLSLLHDLPATQRPQHYAAFVQDSVQCYVDIVFWFLQKHRPSAVAGDKVTCPMLILSGTKDRLIRPGVIRKIAKCYPQSTLEWIPNRGHMLILGEEGERIGQRVVTWLATLKEAPGWNGRTTVHAKSK